MATASPQANTFGEVDGIDENKQRRGTDEHDCAVTPITSTDPTETPAELTARFLRDAVPMLDQLYGHAARLTGNRADAEDLLQETRLKAYLYFRSFQRGTNLKGWLYRIMHNAWISTFRATQRRPREYLTGEFTEAQLLAHGRQAFDGARSAEVEVLESTLGDEITDALDALPSKYRMILHYACVEGRPYREIAEIADIPVGTVMSRLHRARRQLHLLLEDVARERGYTRRPAGAGADT